jgi:hypothetical protein
MEPVGYGNRMDEQHTNHRGTCSQITQKTKTFVLLNDI